MLHILKQDLPGVIAKFKLVCPAALAGFLLETLGVPMAVVLPTVLTLQAVVIVIAGQDAGV